MSAVISQAAEWVRMGRASQQMQQLAFSTSLNSAITMEEKEFLDPNAAELAALVVEAMRTFTSRKPRRAVVGCAAKAAALSETFTKALTAAVVKAAAGVGQEGKPCLLGRHELLGVLAMSRIAVDNLNPETAKKAVSKLLEVQGSLVEALSSTPVKWMSSSRVLCGEAGHHPSVGKEMLEIVKVTLPTASVSAPKHALVRAMLDRAGLKQHLKSEVQAEALTVFCDKVINGRDRVTPAVAACYKRMFASLTEEEFSLKVMPAVTRSLRRTPEVAMTALSALLEGSKVHIDAQAVELTTILVQQMRVKELVRQLAVDTLRSVARHTHDATAVGQVATVLQSLLDGSAEGKIKAVTERQLLTAALTVVAESPCEGEGVAAVAAKVVAFTATACKAEANDEARGALYTCTAAWLCRLRPAEPHVATLDTVAALLADAIKDGKQAVARQQALRAVVQAMAGNADIRQRFLVLAEPAAKVVAEALVRPALRQEGVLALTVAASLAAHCSVADMLLEQHKVWAGVLQPSSTLLTPVGAAKLAPGDAVWLVTLASCLLQHHTTRLAQQEGGQDLVCRLLVSLALHWSPEVRRAAHKALLSLGWSKASKAPQSLLGALLRALLACMASRATTVGPLAVAPDASGEDAILQHGTLALRLVAVLNDLVPEPRDAQLEAPQLCALLLAAHHPTITGPLPKRSGAQVWETLAKRLTSLPKTLPGMASLVAQVLFGPLGVRAPTLPERQAAQQALGACMLAAPTAMWPHVYEGLGKLLDSTAHDALTAEELDMWATPAGILSTERVQQGVYVGEVVESKQRKAVARGRFKTSNRAFTEESEEDDDEPVVVAKPTARPSMAVTTAVSAGRGGVVKKDAAARQAEWRQAKLNEEAQVRARVNELRRGLELGCATLTAVASGNTRAAALRLEPLQELVMPLLSSPIVGIAAFEAVRALAECMPQPLGACSLSTAASLRLVVLAQVGGFGISYPDVPKAAQVADVVSALQHATFGRRQLTASAYRFIFPILQAVLSSPVHTPLHDDALALVAIHCGGDAPRPSSLDLLYHLLGVMPAYKDRVAPLLHQLAVGATTEGDMRATARGVLHAASAVRSAALSALALVPALTRGGATPVQDMELVCMLHLARHDVDTNNAQAGEALWEKAGCSVPSTYVQYLASMATQTPMEVEKAAGAALSSAAKLHPGTVGSALASIITMYEEGSVHVRHGAAIALRALASDLGDAEVSAALDFLIRNGLADHNDKVRAEMVAAGTAIVDTHGADHAPRLLPLFEGYLVKQSGLNHEEEERYDLVREGVVVFLGTLARHLPPADPKRSAIVEMLVGVLSTPSEAVQRAVSNCLSPLMVPLAADRAAVDKLVAQLLHALTKGKTYGERRGAAYGVSGLVKGLGIMSMKNCGIMDALKAAVEDKKDAAAREGALLGFECLSDKLGKLFEPYIIYILPLLLQCFGDPLPQIRAATVDAARLIMGQLSASGVKLVLPALLKGLEDKVWRTKQGSVTLLGSMAHCAPKQLGSCLPTIVPRLSEVLGDPHPKVQEAANKALKEIGSVIRNPEVSTLVPSLLAAIADPNAATRYCLDTLLETVFVNTIDAASLALIVPVIHRGLRDRAGETKKRAARITGNMASLVNDPKDMVPYVPLLLPELQKALVDPLPEVRAFSARAMGSLLQGMGTEQFGDLVPWLITTLKSHSSTVERQGAAQGLAEVLAVLGGNHLEALLPELLAGCADRSSPTAREGHLVLLHYLPITMETVFQSYLGRVLPAVLDGLSDDSEGVRDAALGAGRVLVDHYAGTSLPLLLPAVEEGVFANNWRIRQSSVKLLGKLLFKVAGTTGNVVVDGGSDDEGAAEETYNQAIVDALGMGRRNEVLARLYVSRSDAQYVVRNESLHVWKSVVANTPKTLAQLLPTLMQLIIEALATDSEERQLTAGRCLGELVRKMGDRVLGRIIPILVAGVKAPSVSTRQGVCLGMKEVLENISRQQLTDYMADVLPAVQTALCDEEPGVREAAGAAFSIMFRAGAGAGSAVDAVVPAMLEGLAQPSKYHESIEGLRVILSVRPQMLNSVLPKLMKQPLQVHALHALQELASVAGPVLQHHIRSVLPPLLVAANKVGAGEKEVAAAEAAKALALAVPDEAVHLLLVELRKGVEDPAKRRASAELLAAYAAARKSSPQPLFESLPQLLDALISLFAHEGAEVVLSCWRAVDALASLIPKEEAADYVRCVKEAVSTARETERRKRTGRAVLVAGLCLPKALTPLLPVYLQGVLQGASTEVRELAAEGLGELVAVTSEEAVKPYVVQITGPLIRIIGDRFPSQIKAAILVTLGVLIAKAGIGLKPFVPQLQTTFLKCLADAADAVRAHAAVNLGALAKMSPRVEQLATELATSARTAEPQIRNAYLVALRGLLVSSGERLSPAISANLGDSLREMNKLAAEDDGFRHVLAACLGAHAKHAAEDQIKATLAWGPLATNAPLQDRPLHACVLATLAGEAGNRLLDSGLVVQAMEAATRFSRDSDVALKVAGGRAAARLAVAHLPTLAAACTVLGGLMGPDQNTEVARQAALSLRRMAATLAAAAKAGAAEPYGSTPLEAHFPAVMPALCALASNTSGPIKLTSELSLARILQLESGVSDIATRYLATNPGSIVRSTLTDPFMRRVGKLGEDDELFADEEY